MRLNRILLTAIASASLIELVAGSPIGFFGDVWSYFSQNEVYSNDLSINHIPTEKEAADVARTLVNRESLANINTFKAIESSDNNQPKLLPVSSMEYYVDCDKDGDPYWLVVDIGSTFQNIKHGSDYTFTIRVGDHPIDDHVNSKYPGGIVKSPAGSPRVNLQGSLQEVTFNNPVDRIKLEKCFIERHPDAKWWLPSNAVTPHSSHWLKFKVSEAYLVGGFGDRAYIGTINSDLYHSGSIIEN